MPGRGIGEGDSDVVGARASYDGYCLLNVFPGLSRITELEKKVARPDVLIAKSRACCNDIGYLQPFIHSVEDFLRAGFNAHPYLCASGALEIRNSGFCHQIGTGLNLEGEGALHRFDFIRELVNPVVVESKDIVSEPDVLHSVHLFEFADFRSD